MRIKVALLVVYLLLMGYVFTYSQAEEADVQKDPYFWDFGQVSEGELIEHTFELANDSPDTLLIKRVHTSCGCTASEVKEKEIPPGESVDIQVKFSSRSYSGITKQYIYVYTNRKENHIIKLTIKADIQRETLPDNN